MGDEALFEVRLCDIPLVDMYKKASDYWRSGVGWIWPLLSGFLPNHIEDRLAALFFVMKKGCRMRFVGN